EPRELGADVAQTIRSERPVQDERLVDERPLMRMLRVLPPEVGKKLAAFELEIGGQGSGLQIRLFQLDARFVVPIELEDNVSEAFEIGINRAVQRDFGVAQGETALDWIMIAELQPLGWIGIRRPSGVHQGVETDIH